MPDGSQCPDCGREIPADAPLGQCPWCLLHLGQDKNQDAAESGEVFHRDRNLLFGVLALQLRFVRPQDFLDAAAAWSTDPGRNVADRLVEAGALPAEKRALVDGLVEEAVEQHGGDESQALDAFGGESAVAEQISRAEHSQKSREAATKLGIPLDVEDVDSSEVSAVLETPGRYSRKSEYSRGGMGRILLVHDEYLSRDIALKELIPRSDSGTPTAKGGSPVRQISSMIVRFLREAKVTGQLEHPSIVPVYELGRRPDGTLYYTMKLVRGQTLGQGLRNAKTLEERMTFLSHYVSLCQAIGYAHSRNVVHRDIKPANVMIGEFGETVVIDWGLAKVVGQDDIYEEELRETWSKLRGKESADPIKTAYGSVLGTPQYMAPEQARGLIDEIDARTDVFALGTVLYELLTSRMPFAGGSTEAVFSKVIKATPTPISELSVDVAPELVSICARAMEKEPDKRYPNAKALADDVQRFLNGAVVQAYQYSPQEVLIRFYRRHRTALNAAAAALIAVVALGIFSYINIREARDDALAARDSEVVARAESDAKSYVAQIRLAQQYLDNNQYDDGREALWTTEESRRDWEWGYLLNRAYQEIYAIPEVIRAVASPDGTRIATNSTTQPIRIFASGDGSLVTTFDDDTVRLADNMLFTPDGTRLVAGCLDSVVRVWDAATGRVLVTTSVEHIGPIREIAINSAGTLLATTAYRDPDVFLWNLNTGALLRRFSGHCEGPDAECYADDIQFSSNAAYLASDATDGTTIAWNTETGEQVYSAPGSVFRFVPGTDTLVVSDDLDCMLSDLATGLETLRLPTHETVIRDIDVSPDGERIATIADNGNIRIWSTRSGEELLEIPVAPVSSSYYASIRFGANGNTLLSHQGRLPLQVWDSATGSEMRSFSGHSGENGAQPIFSAQLLPESARALSIAEDRTLRVWNARSNPGERIVIRRPANPTVLAQSNDGARIVAGFMDHTLPVLDAASGQPVAMFATFSLYGARAVDMNASGTRVAAAMDPFTPMIVDVGSGDIVAILRGHEGHVNGVDFDRAGLRVVTAAWDGVVRVWNAETGALIYTLEGHAGEVNAAVYSPDGLQILSLSSDRTARIWNAESGDLLHTLQGHQAPLLSGAWSPDASVVATGSEDGSIRIWSPVSGERIATLEGLPTPPAGMAFSATGDRLFSAHGSAGVLVWDTTRWEELVKVDKPGATFGDVFVDPEETFIRTYSRSRSDVREWTAVSWRHDDLPAARDGEAWRERFERYQRSQIEESGQSGVSITGPVNLTIITTKDVLLERVARLERVIAAEASLPPLRRPDDAGGLMITAGPRRDAVARLCLLEGDRIPSVDNTPVTGAAGGVASLRARIASTGNGEKSAPFELVRDNRRYTARFHLVPVQQTTMEVAITREQALAAFDAVRSTRAGSYASGLQLHEKIATSYGEFTGNVQEFTRMFASKRINVPVVREGLLTLGRVNDETWVAIDGNAFANFDDAIYNDRNISDTLRAGETYNATETIERGEFVRVNRTIDIK